MKLPLKIPHHWHEEKLGEKIFLPTAHPARNGTYRDFFLKTKKNSKKFQKHDLKCLLEPYQ